MVGEITGESIKSAIALKLKSSFAVITGDPPLTTYPKIYKEETSQGIKKPYFFIWTLDASQQKIMRNNYTRTYMMNVRYHLDEVEAEKVGKQNEILAEIGNKLLDCLNIVDVPIFLGNYDIDEQPIEETLPVYGQQMSWKTTEGVLQLFVTYQIKARQYVEEIPDMQTLLVNNINY